MSLSLGLGLFLRNSGRAPPPVALSVSPAMGTAAGGTAITITGTGFAAGATVTIGGAAATSVVVVGPTSITAVTPAGTAGAANVVVTNTDAQSSTLASGFTFIFDPSSIADMLIRYVVANAVTSSGGTRVASIPNTGTLGAGAANANNISTSGLGLTDPLYSADAGFNGQMVAHHNVASLLRSIGSFTTTVTQPSTWYAVTDITDTGDGSVVEVRVNRNGSSTAGASLGVIPSTDNLRWGDSFAITKTSTALYGKHVTCLVLNGASTALYIDDMTTAVAGGSGTGGSADTTGIRIGANTATVSFKWAEQIGYLAAHDATQRANVKSYLTATYGT